MWSCVVIDDLQCLLFTLKWKKKDSISQWKDCNAERYAHHVEECNCLNAMGRSTNVRKRNDSWVLPSSYMVCKHLFPAHAKALHYSQNAASFVDFVELNIHSSPWLQYIEKTGSSAGRCPEGWRRRTKTLTLDLGDKGTVMQNSCRRKLCRRWQWTNYSRFPGFSTHYCTCSCFHLTVLSKLNLYFLSTTNHWWAWNLSTVNSFLFTVQHT